MNINLKHVTQIYFIGIGGIGMSALAFHFLRENKMVYGYDKTKNEICQKLESLGATIEYDEQLQLAQKFINKQSLVIYTPAIQSEHPVYTFFKNKQYPIYKRAEVLGLLSKEKKCIAIAGTHGKTTITSMLAFLLKENNIPMTAFLGGISQNYKSNYIYNGDGVLVIEADEFDRSLLQLQPDYAVISNIDPDHLDIYKDEKELLRTFKQFTNHIKHKNHLYHNRDIPFSGKTLSVNAPSDYHAKNIKIKNGVYYFDLVLEDKTIYNISLQMPGAHNLFNAIAAITVASAYMPYKAEEFAQSLSKYTGVERRFNYLIKKENLVVIDDYAHHPTEILAVYNAVKQMHKNQETMVVFQPHLYSRTKDFADDFANTLNLFDKVRLLEIYPAREKPISGINAQFLLNKIKNPNKKIITKQDIIPHITKSKTPITVIMGAGDIGVEAQKIKKHFAYES